MVMYSKNNFLPESMYEIDSKINRKELSIGTIVAGKVYSLKQDSQTFIVELGNNIVATMSISESTIYPLYSTKREGEFSPTIYRLVGKTIRAVVINLEGDIQLSRKQHMLIALEHLKEQLEFSNAYITDFSEKSAFMDIGAGITGVSQSGHFSPTVFKRIRDVGVKLGTVLTVKNLDFNKRNKTFTVSRVQMLPKAEDVLSVGQKVECRVFDRMSDNCYYALINKTICCIIRSRKIKLQYGDNVVGIVKKITEKGPKLEFISFCD